MDRIQDIELMHMRYALESAVLALGAMEKGTTAERDYQQAAFCHLNDLSKHLESIDNIARKVISLWFVFCNTLCILSICIGSVPVPLILFQILILILSKYQ